MKVEWDFTHPYSSDKDWNEDFENLKNKIALKKQQSSIF